MNMKRISLVVSEEYKKSGKIQMPFSGVDDFTDPNYCSYGSNTKYVEGVAVTPGILLTRARSQNHLH